MKKCPFCKAEIEENARFCLYCMTELEEKQTIEFSKEKNTRWLLLLATFLVFVIIVGIILTLSEPKNLTPKNDSSDLVNESIFSETTSTTVTASNNTASITDTANSSLSSQTNTTSIFYSSQNVQESESSKNKYDGNKTNQNTDSAVVSNTTTSEEKEEINKTSSNISSSKASSNSSIVSSENSKTDSLKSSAVSNGSKTSSTSTVNKTSSGSKTDSQSKTEANSSNTTTGNQSGSDSSQSTSSPENSSIISSENSSNVPSAPITEVVTYKYRDAIYGDDFSANANLENCVVITGVNNPSANGEYIIPETIDNKKVVAIMGLAFCDNGIKDTVKKVIVPTTVKTIWSNAFANCYNMTDIYFCGNAIYTDFTAFADADKRVGTLTVHCSASCHDRNFRNYKSYITNYLNESCGDYSIAYEEWNG